MTTPNDGTTVPVVTAENGTTETVVEPVVAPVIKTEPQPDAVTTKLLSLGVEPDMIEQIKTHLGARTENDLANMIESDLTGIGMLRLPARALIIALAPVQAVQTITANTSTVDPNAELSEGQKPTKAHVESFANVIGADPFTLMMLMNNQGGDMNLAGMVPIANIVNGYNPKRRDMFLMLMGQVEQRLKVPVVVINGDGSINRELTIEYIDGLEEGRQPAENDIYFDGAGTPHEVIRVGVDAQSVEDADPLDPTKSLQKNGMGIGRVNWNKIPLDVRQVAYYASTRTKEIDPANDSHLTWLRDHIKQGVNRLIFHGQAPAAISAFNEAARTGSLPTLRVMLSRSPRRQEVFPRRRKTSPADLTGIGGEREF